MLRDNHENHIYRTLVRITTRKGGVGVDSSFFSNIFIIIIIILIINRTGMLILVFILWLAGSIAMVFTQIYDMVKTKLYLGHVRYYFLRAWNILDLIVTITWFIATICKNLLLNIFFRNSLIFLKPPPVLLLLFFLIFYEKKLWLDCIIDYCYEIEKNMFFMNFILTLFFFYWFSLKFKTFNC